VSLEYEADQFNVYTLESNETNNLNCEVFTSQVFTSRASYVSHRPLVYYLARLSSQGLVCTGPHWQGRKEVVVQRYVFGSSTLSTGQDKMARFLR